MVRFLIASIATELFNLVLFTLIRVNSLLTNLIILLKIGSFLLYEV